MSIKKQIVLIPYWIQDTLKRKNISLIEAFNLPKLKDMVAQNDLIGFFSLQSEFEKLIGVRYTDSLWDVWYKSIPKDNKELIKYFNDMILPISRDCSIKEDIHGRLFSGSNKEEKYPDPFTVIDLTQDAAGIVIYPGHYHEQADAEQQETLIEALLKLLYIYNTHDVVARTEIFKRYLELLANK